MTKQTKIYPSEIYVVRETENNDSWLATYETVDALDEDKAVIAVYRLIGTRTLRISKTLTR
jgi:hypothetical protein